MQVGLPVRIPATRTTSNLAADALTSGIIKVGILHDGFSYHFIGRVYVEIGFVLAQITVKLFSKK